MYSGIRHLPNHPSTFTTHPSSQTDSHANPPPPTQCLLLVIYMTFSVPEHWQQSTHLPHILWHHQTAKPTSTTTPCHPHTHIADVEVAEKWLHILATLFLALSASDNVAGTWRHFSKAFSSAKCYVMVPLHGTMQNNNTERHEVPKHMGGVNTKHVFCLLGPPSNNPSSGTTKYHPMLWKSEEKTQKYCWHCLSTPWQHWQQLGTYMPAFSITPGSRESRVTPCEVSGL